MRAVTASLFLLLAGAGSLQAGPSTCSYTTYQWNVNQRAAVNPRRVQHPYSSVTGIERDAATGCTVCEEDQRWVALPGIEPFRACHRIADKLESVLLALLQQGEDIRKVAGYRVGMTRGDVDVDGNRTRFSNHSFGIAVDINDQQNGLYDQCLVYGPQCRLIKGGPWAPDQPGSLAAGSAVVKAMRSMGMQWGGQIQGKQKDFMHFSPSGY